MATNGWEDIPTNSGWEDIAPAKGGFKSGTAFHDTKELFDKFLEYMSHHEDTRSALKDFDKRDKMSPEERAAWDKKFQEHGENSRAAGMAVLDTVAALPAMVAGGVKGAYTGVKEGDASKGLKAGEEAMHAFLPSTLLGAADDQKRGVYNAAMAPVTGIMDTLNAVPQGYGEMLNAMGHPAAAQQVTDAGKLGIMVGAGYHGAKGMVDSVRGKKLTDAEQKKLDALDKGWEDVPAPQKTFENVNSAADRGIAGTAEHPQGELFGEQPAPTRPMDQQGDLFNGMPPEFGDPTLAHADDFGAINPYDVGGHVSEAMQGRDATIDNAQGDLLGGRTLEDAQRAPDAGQNSLRHDTIPYEKTFPFDLEPMDQAAKRNEMGLNMDEVDQRLSLVPKDEPQAPVDAGTNRWEQGPLGSRDVARSKVRERALEEEHRQRQEAELKSTKEAAFAAMEKLSKETDYTKMEAQRELDFADSINSVESSPGRNFFTDPNNREKVARPEDREVSTAREFFLDPNNREKVPSHGDTPARGFFLDPRNRDRMDFHSDHEFAKGELGDKSLMHPEATHAMTEALARGDVNSAMDAIIQNHENVAFRNLAAYLKGKLEGISIRMHDEGILKFGDKHATGYFDPATRTVGLSRVGAVSPHTVLHELVHALTSDFVNMRPNDMRVIGIKDLFNKLNELGMQKEFPNVSNVKEFLAEAFSNPEFQDFLKEHRVAEKSMWKRFVDNVKSILGFSSTDRNALTTALEHTMDLGKQVMEAGKEDQKAPLKDAGMPGKLADLMVVRKKYPEPVKNPDVTKLKVPGLKDAISDFKFEDRPMEEIIKEARTQDDIPNTVMEKLGQQLQAGGLFESLKTRNLVVKATYERITRASQEYARNIKTYLTDPHTGLKAYMRALDTQEKAGIHAAMMKYEGVRELSNHELRTAGFNEKQIAYYNKYREQSNRFFDDINKRREELGMAPLDKRVAHIAGRFMGDFSRFIFDTDGKIVGRISGSTRWELNHATKWMQAKHPEYQMGKPEYNKLGNHRNPADRFSGLMEALNFLTKTDADVARVMDSYKAYLQSDAIGYLNATRHAKAKVKDAGGIHGSEGHKDWKSKEKNAEEGMKAQLAYFEQGYKWMAMEKAVHDLKPLLGDEQLALNTPNALKWAEAYKAHALGKQEHLADLFNWTASMFGEYSGLGHTNIFKANAKIKHLTMQKFMGLGNIPFSVTQLMQPVQVHPPMVALLKQRGLEFSATKAQLDAANTHLKLSIEQVTGKPGDYTPFERAALDYAERADIMAVKMADHTKDINESKAYELYSKIADVNIKFPERLTRGTSFMFYAHLLKDAGVPIKDIFGAAENMTNMTMVNYHPLERPMGYAKLGWVGDIASTLTRYKHNQLSQAAFYTREGIHSGKVSGYAPLATFVGTSLAFGGIMGFFAYNEADALYQLFTEHVMGKPDTLTNVLFQHNTPEIISHGLFSTLGLDMTTRFSNANMIPDSIPKALIPYGSAVLDVLQSGTRFAMDPTSETKRHQFLKSAAPQSVQGLLENEWFTEKRPDGSNLYQNGTAGPNMGKGRVARSDGDMALRAFGFRDIRESKELAKNYSDSQIEKGNANVVDGILTKAKYAAMDGTLTSDKLRMLATRAAQLGEDPNSFAAKLAAWEGARHLTQEQQQKLRDAMSGFKGAMNIKEGR